MSKHALKLQLSSLDWLTLDALVGACSIWIGFKLTPYVETGLQNTHHVSLMTGVILFSILLSCTSHIVGLQDTNAPNDTWFTVSRSIFSVSLAIVGLAFVVNVVLYEQLGRYILAQAAFLSFGGLFAGRLILRHKDLAHRNIGLLGTIEDKLLLTKALNEVSNSIVFSVETINELQVALNTTSINYLIIAPSKEIYASNHILEWQQRGLVVASFASFMENSLSRIPSSHLTIQWFLDAKFQRQNTLYTHLKRLLDVIVGASGLICAAPFIIVFSILLKFGGTVFYSQARVGRNGQIFKIWKLRSMQDDAEKTGAQWAQKNDRRVTKLGKFLRKTRFDETPQFWNILRGDMSLIGPRPERPEFIVQLSKEIPFYNQRHVIRPGLTGWAQINYPYGASVEDAAKKLQFDLYYVKHASVLLDLQIILRTVGVIMKGSR